MADNVIVRIPREPKEVHSWHKDGVRWAQEGEGQERPDHTLEGGDCINWLSRIFSQRVFIIRKPLHLPPRTCDIFLQ